MRACLARLGGQYCQDRWVAAGLAASVVRERRNAAANRGPGQKAVVLYAMHCTGRMWADKPYGQKRRTCMCEEWEMK
jgi:hypothetical protein